ncbi:MAG: T9SS type A sorting domain-containing protein [Bacteroidia bacterium]|nr:T9SS type A sorting domain-containing protein [Bacteroidia bacterium]HQU99599.1 T9SS type A sorting domain-containing protein [Bacteroidia bacterium]
MKNFILLFVSVFTSVVIWQCKTTAPAPAGAIESRQRVRYELARLCDPATGRIPPFMRMREITYANTLPSDALYKASSAVNFTLMGPNNLGGRTRALAIDVTNENIMLAAGVSGGVYRTTDGGNNWTKVGDVNGFQGVISIVQDTRPGHTQDWYFQTGEGYGTSASAAGAFYLGNGLYKSTDGGLTWSGLSATNQNSPQGFNSNWEVGWNLAFDKSDTVQTKLYAAVYGAIYKTTDGGNTWSYALGSSTNQSYFTDVAVTSTGVVYGTLSSDGASKGIYRSVGGIGFVNILPAGFPATYDRIVIGIDPNNENVVYFFAATPNNGKYTYYFGDEWTSLYKYEYISGNGQGAGGVWTNLSANLPDAGNTFNLMATQNGYDMAVRVMPGNSNVVFVCGTNIYRSTTAFADSLNTTLIGGYQANSTMPIVFANQYEYPGHHPDQHNLAFLPSNPSVMFSCSDGGISKTTDGLATNVQWNFINSNYTTSQFYALAIDHGAANNDIVIGGLQDNGTWYTNSNNPNTPWIHSLGGDGAYCAISNTGHYYMSQQLGSTVKTDVDANGNVLAYTRIDPVDGADYQWSNPFTLDPNNNNIMYLTAGRRLYRNSDLSALPTNNTWNKQNTNWTYFTDTLTTAGELITAVAASTVPAHRVYYGTNKRKVFRIDNAHTGSPTATLLNIPANVLPAGTGYVTCIAVNPQNADEIMVVLSNYNIYSLAFSKDGGSTWARCGGNLEQTATGSGNGPSCRWATIAPVSNGTVYLVGTSVGLFATDTLIAPATVWTKQGVNTIGSNVVNMMDYRVADGMLAIATHGGGIFTTKITNNNVAAIAQLKENGISLMPNPVTDWLEVNITDASLNKTEQVSIVNQNGQIVMQLKPDEHLKINVSKLPIGLYYVNAIKGNKRWSKSFIKQ